MGKPSTDPGLGPSSEARLKAAPRDAETAPGAVEDTKPKPQKRDTVDVLLDGFEGREERPRILPPSGIEITPTPPPPQPVVRKDLTPTAPGSRQRRHGKMIVGIALGVVVVLCIALLAKKLMTADVAQPTPVATLAVTAPLTPELAPTQAEQPTPTATTATAPATTTTITPKPKPTATPTAKPTSRDPHLVIEN